MISLEETFNCAVTSPTMWPVAANEVSCAWFAFVSLAVSRGWTSSDCFTVTDHLTSCFTPWCRSISSVEAGFVSVEIRAAALVRSSACIRCLCAPLAAETYSTLYRGGILNSVCTSSITIGQSSRKKVIKNWNQLIKFNHYRCSFIPSFIQ